jgi:hypothetical protein
MSVIKCRECRLVNKGEARECRRCGAPLYLDPKAAGSQSISFGKLGRIVAIPAIIVIVMLSIYALNRNAKGGAKSESVSRGNVTAIEGNSATPTSKKAIVLSRSFVVQMDQNLSDRDGKGFQKNQILAAETLKLLKEQVNGSLNPEEQSHWDEFTRLLERYHEQLAKYNADNVYLASAYERTNADIARVQADPDLSPEQKAIREKGLRLNYHDEAEQIRIAPADIDATEQALRALTAGS